MTETFVPGKAHRLEWAELADSTGLFSQSNRHAWVEIVLTDMPSGAHQYIVLAGRSGVLDLGTFRATLRGCDCESPSCEHPAKLGASRPVRGWGGHTQMGRRRVVACKCRAYAASSGATTQHGKRVPCWVVAGACNGSPGWRPIDVLAFATALLNSFKPGPARPYPVSATSAALTYSPDHVPAYALENGATREAIAP